MIRRYLAPITLAVSAVSSVSGLAQALGTAPATSNTTSTAAASPAPGNPLQLGEAVREALASHPDLAAARYAVEAAEGARIQAAARPNPSIDALQEDFRRDTRTTTLMWNQPIELGGKREARVAVSERALALAQTQLQTAQLVRQSLVIRSFFSALIAQERVALANAALDVARRGSDAASKRVQAGKVSPVEETRARVAESGVQIELLQAQGELRGSLVQLRAAIGPGSQISSVDGNALATPVLPSQADVAARIGDAPEVRESLLEVQRLQAVVDLERARRKPDIMLNVGAKRASDPGRLQAVIGITVPIPVSDTNRGNIIEASRKQLQAEEVARATLLRVAGEAAAAQVRMGTAVAESITLRDEVVPRAQSVFDATTKGFELGKFSYLEALDAQRTLLQSRSQYLRALGDAQQAAAELRRLLGLGAVTDLF